ncbi:MAG: Lrp/AsnC family transcriptional regulator [Microbacterium sp.]|uniref:Lrp/AsnC family transcriptional regulator n=1 Tax=Microbacterium sp. TaxID=51671 RepID=UPI003F99189C
MSIMVELDEIDLKLVHALQVAGRATFRSIADALGISERMLSRRYARLRSQLLLRIVGTTDAQRLGQLDWFVRCRVSGGSADKVAAALATHEDTSWVSTLSGSDEVTCILRTASFTGEELSPVLSQLRRSAHVHKVSAQCLLAPVAGVGGWPGRTSALTDAEEQTLKDSAGQRPAPNGTLSLSREDLSLVRALAEDGRASVTRLSRTVQVPESSLSRRIAELTAQGALRFEIDIDPRLYGRSLEVICWLEVQPNGIGDVIEALAAHPEVAYASTTTGTSSIVAITEFTGPRDLHDYLSQKLGRLSAIRSVETALVDRRVKRAGAVLSGV